MEISARNWSSVSRLLDEALDLDAAARTGWLETLRRTQPDLAPALEKLLAAHGRIETAELLHTLPVLDPASAGAAAADAAGAARAPFLNAPARLAPDTLVGPYRLIRELGVGGMAHVWLAARADGAFERDIALKLPQVSLLRRHLAERFARERDILARLEHPHIARLYDAGVAADGTPYLAMEFVAGQPLHTYCDERKLDISARLALFDQVLAAVQYAHANLVIHRDLKPSNILVDEQGQVRLLDFGIAKLVADDERAHETQLTQLSGRAMTPDYASPEQILGEPLTIASDVYSLGVVLFELLTGARPYKLKLKSAAHLELAILDAEAASPSGSLTEPAAAARGATVAKLARALRGDLDTIVRKALAKQPALRYLTIAEFADDLRRLRDGQTVLARPPSWSYRARKFVVRNRLAVGAAAAIAFTLLAGTAVSLWQAREARQQARFALQSAGRHEGVRQMYGELIQTIANLDAATFAKPNSVSNVLKAKLDELEPQYAARPEEWAGILNAALTNFSFLGDFEAALATSVRYLDVLHRTGADNRTIILAYASASRAASVFGRREEAETWLRRGMAHTPLSTDPPTLKAQFILIADVVAVLPKLGKRREAIDLLDTLRRFGARHLPADRDFATVMESSGRIQFGYDNLAAIGALEEGLRIYRANPETDTLELATTSAYLGMVYTDSGRAAGAEPLLRQAHETQVRLYGATDHDTLGTLGWLALTLARQQKFAEARALLADARTRVGTPTDRKAKALAAMLSARLMQVAMLEGHVADAAAASASIDAVDTGISIVPYAGYLFDTRLDLLLQTGRTAEAARLVDAHVREVASVPVAPEAFRAPLAEVRLLLARGDAAAADSAAAALLKSMNDAGVVSTWQLVTAQEWAAMAAAGAGNEARASALLAEAAQIRARLRAPSPVDQAESELRQARVARLLGRHQDGDRLVASAQAGLGQQHATSPRLAAARALAITASR